MVSKDDLYDLMLFVRCEIDHFQALSSRCAFNNDRDGEIFCSGIVDAFDRIYLSLLSYYEQEV